MLPNSTYANTMTEHKLLVTTTGVSVGCLDQDRISGNDVDPPLILERTMQVVNIGKYPDTH